MQGTNPAFDPEVIEEAHQYAEQQSIDYQRKEQLNDEISGVAGGTVFVALLLIGLVIAAVAYGKSRGGE